MGCPYLRILLIPLICAFASCGGGGGGDVAVGVAASPGPTTATASSGQDVQRNLDVGEEVSGSPGLTTAAASSTSIVPCDLDPDEECIEITLECITAPLFEQQPCDTDPETIQVPNGRDIYAFLVSGFYQNRDLNMFHFYNFARCLQEKNAYVHYAWWNNLLAPYMEKPLHNSTSNPAWESEVIPLADSIGGLWDAPVLPFRPQKANPPEDHQFQEDAKLVIQAIRRHNRTAAIILVGHSMGGDAVTRLGTNPELKDDDGDKIDIALLAPVDPVRNRTCTPYDQYGGYYCGGSLHFTRWYVMREDWHFLPPKRTLGDDIKFLYHRWQHENTPPYDWALYQGPLFVHEILFDYPNHTWASNINGDETNIQSSVVTDLFSSWDVPVSEGGPNINGALDGHGEIVGFRGVDIAAEDPEDNSLSLHRSWPLALEAAEFWPSLREEKAKASEQDRAIVRNWRVSLLRHWENDAKYLDDFGWAPLTPPDSYCTDQEIRPNSVAPYPVAHDGEPADYCTYCMVSGDLCTILKKRLKFYPVADAGPDQTVECSGPDGALVTLDGSGSRDPNPEDTLTYTWDLPGGRMAGMIIDAEIPLGTHTITLTVNDGSFSDTDTVDITVQDTTAPTIHPTFVADRLWPPNHDLVTVTAVIDVQDTCDVSPSVSLLSITSSEPDDGLGDGNTINDIQGASFGTDDREFQLRAERSGPGSGRVYTVTYEAVDGAGNESRTSADVTVPHDQ